MLVKICLHSTINYFYHIIPCISLSRENVTNLFLTLGDICHYNKSLNSNLDLIIVTIYMFAVNIVEASISLCNTYLLS